MKQRIISYILSQINHYIALGNDAIKQGNEDESIKWYRKGLTLAIQVKNKQKEEEIGGLIMSMI